MNYKLFGLLSAITFLISSIIAMLTKPEYDFFNNNFSNLGIGQTALIFNFGLIITSIFLLIYFYYLFFKKEKSIFFFTLGLFSSIGLLGVGLFTLDFPTEHFIFAGMFFVTSFILILTKIIQHQIRTKNKIFFFINICFLLIIFCYMLFLRIPIMQKLSVYSIIIWYTIYFFEKKF